MTTADPESRLVARLAAALGNAAPGLPTPYVLAARLAPVIRDAGYVETLELAGRVALIERNDSDTDEVLDARAASLIGAGAAAVLIVDPGQDVRTLDVEEMRAAGWQPIHDAEVEGDAAEDAG